MHAMHRICNRTQHYSVGRHAQFYDQTVRHEVGVVAYRHALAEWLPARTCVSVTLAPQMATGATFLSPPLLYQVPKFSLESYSLHSRSGFSPGL